MDRGYEGLHHDARVGLRAGDDDAEIRVGDRVRVRPGTLMHGKSKWANVEQEVCEILVRDVEGTPVTFARLRTSMSIVPVDDLVRVG